MHYSIPSTGVGSLHGGLAKQCAAQHTAVFTSVTGLAALMHHSSAALQFSNPYLLEAC
jgi:hypothetical protein